MYADHLNRRQTVKPGSLMLALGVTILPIAGLIVATQAATIARIIDPPIVVKTIPIPPDPPIDPPKTKQKVDPKVPVDHIYTPPVTPIPITPTFPIDPGPITPPMPPGPLTGEGSGTGTGITPVVIPKPVLVGPQYDSRYNSALQPPYPADKIRAGESGRVVVRVLIGVDGRVKQVEFVSGANDSFFEATQRQALSKWRFKPATKDGIPVEQWKQMSLRFELSTVE